MTEGKSPVPQIGRYGALVIGAGTNGLAAGIAIAQTGRSVLVVEGRDTIAGRRLPRSFALNTPAFCQRSWRLLHCR